MSGGRLTLIFADVLESKRQASVLSLYNADLAKGALADDTEQSKVVEAHCWVSMPALLCAAWRYRRLTFVSEDDGLAAGVAHCGSSLAAFAVDENGGRSDVVDGLWKLLWGLVQTSGHNSCRVYGVVVVSILLECCNEGACRDKLKTLQIAMSMLHPLASLPVGTR